MDDILKIRPGAKTKFIFEVSLSDEQLHFMHRFFTGEDNLSMVKIYKDQLSDGVLIPEASGSYQSLGADLAYVISCGFLFLQEMADFKCGFDHKDLSWPKLAVRIPYAVSLQTRWQDCEILRPFGTSELDEHPDYYDKGLNLVRLTDAILDVSKQIEQLENALQTESSEKILEAKLKRVWYLNTAYSAMLFLKNNFELYKSLKNGETKFEEKEV